jgi:hypothetical protein
MYRIKVEHKLKVSLLTKLGVILLVEIEVERQSICTFVKAVCKHVDEIGP